MYLNQFLVWHKKFGRAQNILGPLHSKVLLLWAYLKVIFHETMDFSFMLGSNRPNQMPRGIRENFFTPGGALGRKEHWMPNLGSQREQITSATYLILIWPLLCMIPWYHSIIDCSHCIKFQKIHKFSHKIRKRLFFCVDVHLCKK